MFNKSLTDSFWMLTEMAFGVLNLLNEIGFAPLCCPRMIKFCIPVSIPKPILLCPLLPFNVLHLQKIIYLRLELLNLVSIPCVFPPLESFQSIGQILDLPTNIPILRGAPHGQCLLATGMHQSCGHERMLTIDPSLPRILDHLNIVCVQVPVSLIPE
jgi:hypothetical protein